MFEAEPVVKKLKAFVDCVEGKIETVELDHETICFYSGFKPKNLTTRQELEDKLRKDGYK